MNKRTKWFLFLAEYFNVLDNTKDRRLVYITGFIVCWLLALIFTFTNPSEVTAAIVTVGVAALHPALVVLIKRATGKKKQ